MKALFFILALALIAPAVALPSGIPVVNGVAQLSSVNPAVAQNLATANGGMSAVDAYWLTPSQALFLRNPVDNGAIENISAHTLKLGMASVGDQP